MLLTVNRSDLARALKTARAICPSHPTTPILAHVVLCASKGLLTLSGTDLDMYVTAPVAADVERGGAAAFDARALFELVANAPADRVTIQVEANHWAAITCGRAKYKLAGITDRDHPKAPDTDAGEVLSEGPPYSSGEILADVIDRTIYAVCRDETRFHLNGVFLESRPGGLRAVATDGHRLAIAEADGDVTLSRPIIVPSKGALELSRLAGEIEQVRIGKGWLHALGPGVRLSVKLIDAAFPPYEQVVPKDHKRTLTVRCAQFVAALRRAALMADGTRGVKLELDRDGATLTAQHPDLGETSETVEATFDGERLVIGFNAKYAIEALGTFDADAVEMRFGGELDPVLMIATDHHRGVLMPMRV